MALTFQCFFCGRTVPVLRENEVKHVDCPECGARIDVNPEAAVSFGLSSAKPSSCGGCLFIIIILIGVVVYFSSQKTQGKNNRFSTPPKETRSGSYSPNESEARKEIYFIIDRLVTQELQDREKLFAMPLSWKEDFSSLPQELQDILQQKERESLAYQPKITRNMYLKIFDHVKEEKFLDKKDFMNKVTNLYRQSQKLEEEKFYRLCEQNLTKLYECLSSHLFKEKNLPKDLSLKEAILKSPNFTAYQQLVSPASSETIYWDWSIGIHYGFTNAKISSISPEKKDLLFWEKVPSSYQNKGKSKFFYKVILSDGTQTQWSLEKIANALK
ncbi:MAG: hypothetical protein HUU50_15525 [Candidatus Brocadiae bacterium]|nr:hypothetical protein [Candidatus Brocadiia bacterium]